MTAKPSTNLFSEARQDPIDLPTPERVLTVGAHPDDAEFGAGGTLAKWAAEGCEISMLIVTDGSKGTWDEHQDPAHLIAARRSEQRAAAEALGARGDIVFGDFVDGELENNRELQRLIALWVRRVKPDVVMTFDPWKKYMLHPDHRAIGWGVIDGIVAARDHLFFPDQLVDGLTKHRPQAILLFAPEDADHHEDISTSFETKIDALLCHSSQARTTMGDANDSPEARAEFTARIRGWSVRMGEAAGLELAESFKLLRP
ncbi:MAG TPA: PIG-L deacetylase family protein [Acidimicrobiia bacterium]|jgi:LmbE family N-acetylglucosaminyl deacetylase